MIYLSVDPIFQSLWFLSGFDRGLLPTRKLFNQGFRMINNVAKKGYFRMGYKRLITDLKRNTYGWEVLFANNKSRG
jgi:hypothetical protein